MVTYTSPVADGVSVDGTISEEAPAVFSLRSAGAESPSKTESQEEPSIVGKESAVEKSKQPGVAHACRLSKLRHEYNDRAAREVPGYLKAAVKPPMVTSSRNGEKSSPKPSALLKLQDDPRCLLNKGRLQQSHGPSGELETISEQAEMLPMEPSAALKRSSHSPQEREARANAVSSRGDHRRRHGATQQDQLSSGNVYLFSPPKSPPAQLALYKSQRGVLQTCSLDQTQDINVGQLLSSVGQQRGSSSRQHAPRSKNDKGKTNASLAGPATDKPMEKAGRSCHAEELTKEGSLRSTPVSMSASSSGHASSVFSSALSSPAGSKNIQSLLAKSRGFTMKKEVSPPLGHEGSGSPSLKGMAKNLNSIRDGLLRAVEETRQSFFKLDLPPEKWNDWKRAAKKKSAAHGNRMYRVGHSKGSCAENSRSSNSKDQNGRSKNCSIQSSVANSREATSCDDGHNLDGSQHTSGTCKDKQGTHHGYRLVKERSRHDLYQYENKHNRVSAAEGTYFEKVDRIVAAAAAQQEQLHIQCQPLQQCQPVVELHTERNQDHKRREGHESQPQPPQPQQAATGSLSRICEKRADDVPHISRDSYTETAISPTSRGHWQQETKQRPYVSTEEACRERESARRRLSELYEQHQSSVQLHHTQPCGPTCRDMSRSCLTSSNTRSSGSPTSENVSSDGSSNYTASQSSTLVSCVAAADGLSVFASPQIPHLTFPRATPPNPRQSDCKTVCIPPRVSPSYAPEHGNVDGTPIGVPVDRGAAAAAQSSVCSFSRCIVLANRRDAPPSSPPTCSAATRLSLHGTARWVDTVAFSGEAPEIPLSGLGVQQLRSPGGTWPRPQAQRHNKLQPAGYLPVGNAEHRKVRGEEGNTRTEEQGAWRKWARLTSRPQSSAKRVPHRTATEVSSDATLAPCVCSATYPKQKKPYIKIEKITGYGAPVGSAALCYEACSAWSQERQLQQHALSEKIHSPSMQQAAAVSNCTASDRPRISRRSCAESTAEGFRESEEDAPRQGLPQRLGPRDSLQLSPSSCRDNNSSRSREPASSRNLCSRSRSGSTTGRVAPEEQPDRFLARLTRHRMYSHTGDTQKHPVKGHTARQGIAVTRQHDQSAPEESPATLLKSVGRQERLQKVQQPLLNETSRQRPETCRSVDRAKDNRKQSLKLLRDRSLDAACQQLPEQHLQRLQGHEPSLRTEQQQELYEEVVAAQESFKLTKTQSTKVQEIATRVDRLWAEAAENRMRPSPQALPLGGADSCESQTIVRVGKYSPVLLSHCNQHVKKATSAEPMCDSTSECGAQGRSATIKITCGRLSTHALAVAGNAVQFDPPSSTSPHAAQPSRSNDAFPDSPFVSGRAIFSASGRTANANQSAPVRASGTAAAATSARIDDNDSLLSAKCPLSCELPSQPAGSGAVVGVQQHQQCQPQQQPQCRLQAPLSPHLRSHDSGARYAQVTTHDSDRDHDRFSSTPAGNRRSECLPVVAVATSFFLSKKVETEQFTPLNDSEKSIEPVYTTVPYAPSQISRATHAKTSEVVNIGLGGKAIADRDRSEYASSVHDPAASAITSVNALLLHEGCPRPLQEQRRPTQGVQQAGEVNSQKQPDHPPEHQSRQHGKQQGITDCQACKQRRQIDVGSSSPLLAFTCHPAGTAAAPAAQEQAPYRCQAVLNHPAHKCSGTDASEVPQLKGCTDSCYRAKADNGTDSESRSSTAVCYSDGGSSYVDISERFGDGSNCRGCEDKSRTDDSSSRTTSSSSRDRGSTARARGFTKHTNCSVAERFTALYSGEQAACRDKDCSSHQVKPQDKQVSPGHLDVPRPEVCRVATTPQVHNGEELAALRLHGEDFQLHQPVINQLITPTQQQHLLLHMLPAEQQPPRLGAGQQSPTPADKHIQAQGIGAAPETNPVTCGKRLSAVPPCTLKSHALQPHDTSQAAADLDKQQLVRPFTGSSCTQGSTINSILTPRSSLHHFRVGGEKTLHGCKGGSRANENSQEGPVTSRLASEHGPKAFTLPLPCLSFGLTDTPAQNLQPRGVTSNKLVPSREVIDSTDDTAPRSGITESGILRVSNVGLGAGKVVKGGDGLRDTATHIKRCSSHSAAVEKMCGMQDYEVSWHNAERSASTTTTAKHVTPQAVETTSKDSKVAFSAVVRATELPDNYSPLSAACWSYQPAYGSSRRSSVHSGSELSSPRQSPCANDACRWPGSTNNYGVDGALRVSPFSLLEEEQQNVKQPHMQCHRQHDPTGMQGKPQTPQGLVERLQPCQNSQQNPALQAKDEVGQHVRFFSPQGGVDVGSSTKYTASRFLTSQLADASKEVLVAGAAAIIPVRLRSFGASPGQSKLPIYLKGHLHADSSTRQQQTHQHKGAQQHGCRSPQQLQCQQTRTPEGRQKAGHHNLISPSDPNATRGEVSERAEEAVNPTSKGGNARYEPPVCPLPLLHNKYHGVGHGNQTNLYPNSSAFRLNLDGCENSKARQQLNDLLDVVQLLLSTLEGNADDLRQQLTRQQVLPLTQHWSQSEEGGASTQQNLQEREGEGENEGRCDSALKEHTCRFDGMLKERWLRELQQQLHQFLLGRAWQGLSQQTADHFQLPRITHAQAPPTGSELPLLEKRSVNSQPQQQHESRLDKSETESVMRLQQQQDPLAHPTCTVSTVLPRESQQSDGADSAAEISQSTSKCLSASCLPSRIDSMSFDVNVLPPELRTSQQQGLRLLHSRNVRALSAHIGERGNQKNDSSNVYARRISCNARLLATPAFGCSPAEKNATRETQSAVSEATAAAERASAAAAQAAVAAHRSGKVTQSRTIRAAGAPNVLVATAEITSPATPEVKPQEGTSAAHATDEKDFLTLDAAGSNKAGNAVPGLAAEQIPSPSKSGFSASSLQSNKLKSEVLVQREHMEHKPLQKNTENSVVQVCHEEQVVLHPPQLYPVPSPSTFTTAGGPSTSNSDYYKPKPSLIARGTAARREQTLSQQNRRDQPLGAPGEAGKVPHTSDGFKISEPESRVAAQVCCTLVPELPGRQQLSSPQRLYEQPDLSFERHQQSTVNVEPDRFTLAKFSCQERTQQYAFTQSPLRLENPSIPPERSALSHRHKVALMESMQEITQDQVHEEASKQPQQVEQWLHQQTLDTAVSSVCLQQSLGEISTEKQVLELDVNSLHPEKECRGKERLSACTFPSKETNLHVLASTAPTLRETLQLSFAGKCSGELPRAQQQCMSLQYQELRQLHGHGSCSLQPEALASLHLQQQNAKQETEKLQTCPAQDSSSLLSLPQSVLWPLNERLPVGRQKEKEENMKGEERSVLSAVSADATGSSLKALQPNHPGNVTPAEQLQSGRMAAREFEEHSVQQQSMHLEETSGREAQQHQAVSKDSVWYSPVATGASPDLFAFLRKPTTAAAVLSASEQSPNAPLISKGAAAAAGWNAAQAWDSAEVDGALARAHNDRCEPPAALEKDSSSSTFISSTTQRETFQKEKGQQERAEEGQGKRTSFECVASGMNTVQTEQSCAAPQRRVATEEAGLHAGFDTETAYVVTTGLPPAVADAIVHAGSVANAEKTYDLKHMEPLHYQTDASKQIESVEEGADMCGWQAQQRHISPQRENWKSEPRGEKTEQEEMLRLLGDIEPPKIPTGGHQTDSSHGEEHQQMRQPQQNNDNATAGEWAHLLQQKGHQQDNERSVLVPSTVKREADLNGSDHTWSQLTHSEDDEKKVQPHQEVKGVCNQVGVCEVSLAEQRQNKMIQDINEEPERKAIGVKELDQQQHAQVAQCEPEKQRQCILQSEEVAQRECTRIENLEDVDQESLVDLEVELSPSLSSISLPGCSSNHDRSPATRDAEATFTFCDAAPSVADAVVATGQGDSSRDILPGSGPTCKQVSGVLHANATSAKLSQHLAEEDVLKGTQNVRCAVITEAAKKRHLPPSSSPVSASPSPPSSSTALEIVLQECRQNLRPVSQVQHKCVQSPHWNLQQTLVQQRSEPSQQQHPPNSGIIYHRQQHQQGSEKLHVEEGEQQKDQRFPHAPQSQRPQLVGNLRQGHEQQQPIVQRKELPQADQVFQRHEDLPIPTTEYAEEKTEGRRHETFGPRVALSCRAPTVNPELLSPVEAAAAGPSVNTTSVSTVIFNSSRAGHVEHLMPVAPASRNTSTAPSPCALSPAAKQRLQRQHQEQPEQTQEEGSTLPRLSSQAMTSNEQQQQQSAQRSPRWYRGSSLRTWESGTGEERCPFQRNRDSPTKSGSHAALPNPPKQGNNGEMGTRTLGQMQMQGRGAALLFVADCSPVQTSSSLKLTDIAKNSLTHSWSSRSEETIMQKNAPLQQTSSSVEVPVSSEKVLVDITSRTRGGGALAKGKLGRKDAGALSALTTEENEKVAASAEPGTIRQGMEAATIGSTVTTPTEMAATAPGADVRMDRPEESGKAGTTFFRSWAPRSKVLGVSTAKREPSREAASGSATKAASYTSVASSDTQVKKDASDSVNMCKTVKEKISLRGREVDVAPSGEDAEAGKTAEATVKACAQDRRRTVSVYSVEEDPANAVVEDCPRSCTGKRHRRHSLSAAVLRLSGKYRKSTASTKDSGEDNRQKSESSGLQCNSSSSCCFNPVEKNTINTQNTSHRSCSNDDGFDSQQKQVACTLEEEVSAAGSNKEKPAMPPPQMAGVVVESLVPVQLQTVESTALNTEDVRKKEEGAAQPSSVKGGTKCSKKKEETHSRRKNSSSREEATDSGAQILPAAHAPPASIQPRLSYTFFKNHTRHQRQQQGQLQQQSQKQQPQPQREHQQEQVQLQQGLHTQQHRSFRQMLLLPRRKSLSKSDSSATEVALWCQLSARTSESANEHTVTQSKPDMIVSEPPGVPSKRSLSRRFSNSSSSIVGANSVPSPATAVSLKPIGSSTSNCTSVRVATDCVDPPSSGRLNTHTLLSVYQLAASSSSAIVGGEKKNVKRKFQIVN